MSNDLRLRVIMDMANKASAPLRNIEKSSTEAAHALKGARDTLKKLNEQQRAVDGFTQQQAALRQSSNQVRVLEQNLQTLRSTQQANNRTLTQARQALDQHTATLLQQRQQFVQQHSALRESNAKTRALKQTLDQLRQSQTASQHEIASAEQALAKHTATQQQHRQSYVQQQATLRESNAKVRALKQSLDQLHQSQTASAQQVSAAEKALTKSQAAYDKNRDAVFKLRQQLTNLGITKVSEAQRRLKTDTDAANQAIAAQTARLKELSVQQGKLRQLNRNHAQEMLHTGMVAAAGVGAQAAGRGMARPVLSAVQTYAQQEGASSQLAGSMMLANGQVSAEFRQINDLAMSLGDRLPGTTADFIEMMTMLRRQGLSAKSILGGTGEAAAYLGVQLKMPVTAAAEFAAKMQDATRTTERDMMGLMDLIQRTYYLGVDSGNMLQGFTKLSPTLNILKKQGLDAANSLAPLLVMMDQTGMAGEASGNGIRKVIQAGLDAKKLGKANSVLADSGAGFQLNFVNGQGQFAGLDNLFAQLQKVKGITSAVQRQSVIKELFGDDAETLQVLDTLMDKGLTGYNDVIAKLQTQADLRKRVDAELGTISNLWEATTGTFTNVMAAMGQTVAPEVKALTTWLGEVAASTRTWIADHPVLVGWLVKIVAVVAGLSFGLGTLAIVLASIMGPFFVMRFVMGWLGLKFSLWAAAIRVVGTALTWLRGVMLFLAANPVVLAITAVVIAIAAAAYLIYKNWGPITTFFSNLWATVKTATTTAWEWIKAAFFNYHPLGIIIQNWAPITAFFNGLWGQILAGIAALPARFMAFGTMLMDGLVNGITSRLAAVRDTIQGVADSTVGWFKEKLGIRSPSRVFIAAGVNIGEGAAIGIARSTDMVRRAGASIAAAAAIALPAIAPPALAMPKLPGIQQAAVPVALPQVPNVPAITPSLVMPQVPSLAPGIQLPNVPAITPSLVMPQVPSLAPGIQLPNVPAITPSLVMPQVPSLAPGIQLPNVPAITPSLVMPQVPSLAPGIQLPNVPAITPSLVMPQVPALGTPGINNDSALRIDTRPPLASSAAGQRAPTTVQGDTITIQITAAPGTDPQALARAVSAELDRRERAKQARQRSRLGDIH